MEPCTCFYFNGVQNDQCDHGIAYDDVRGNGIPCIKQLSAGAKSCPHYREPTAQEIAAEDARVEAYSADCMKAVEIIDNARKRGSTMGAFLCPRCRVGGVHWRVAPNGHRRAKCDTEHCISFVE